jgi:hypothetical protein
MYRDRTCLWISAVFLAAAVAIPVLYWLLTRGAS